MMIRWFSLLVLLTVGLTRAPAVSAQTASLTELYHFTGGADGGNPVGGVIQDATGTIYGETFRNGSATCTTGHFSKYGCGTVYSWTQSAGLRVLFSFTGLNGAHGNASLVQRGQTLYGVTEYGGANDRGVVFSVSTTGTNFTLLHQFAGADGASPLALVIGSTGTLYGITKEGGNADDGVIFSLTQSGTYTVVHKFGAPTAYNPNSLVIAADGTLVGSTLYGGTVNYGCNHGCGTTYEVTVTGVFKILYSFPGATVDGYYPYVGSIGPGPIVYASQVVAAFSLSAAGYTQLGQYNYYAAGEDPRGGPVYASNGLLYGILSTNAAGIDGSLYDIQDGNVNYLAGWGGQSDGGGPVAEPFATSTNTIIGTTSATGDCGYCGTIWQYGPLPPAPANP